MSTTQLLLSQVKLLLDRNMLEKNIFVPNLEMHSINNTINSVVRILEQQAELQHIKIKYQKLDKDVIVKIDLLRIQQIIINLLTNSLKFSKKDDSIIVVAKVTETQNKTDEVELLIQIRDQGVGISEEDQKNLFKPFFRSTNSKNLDLNKTGNGLGLSICYNIIRCLNGKIVVESKLGKGSSFTVTFHTTKSTQQNGTKRVSLIYVNIFRLLKASQTVHLRIKLPVKQKKIKAKSKLKRLRRKVANCVCK